MANDEIKEEGMEVSEEGTDETAPSEEAGAEGEVNAAPVKADGNFQAESAKNREKALKDAEEKGIDPDTGEPLETEEEAEEETAE